MPPGAINHPSPAFSALKSYMEKNNYSVNIIYWNILLRNLMSKYVTPEIFNDIKLETLFLLPFFSIINSESGDYEIYERLKSFLLSRNPTLKGEGPYIDNSLIEEINTKTYLAINRYIDDANFEDCLLTGFTSKFYQWIPATIVAREIKKRFPHLKTVIGGFGSKSEALAIMKKFQCFDFAIWGEGENSLLTLSELLKLKASDEMYDSVPNCCYRKYDNDSIHTTQAKQIYPDLNSLNTDFEDYFLYAKNQIPIENIDLSVETSRSCHWKKCKYCYLNQGYKYRVKAPSIIVKEISALIKKYNVFKFELLSNDIVAGNVTEFVKLIDELIDFREKTQHEIEIYYAEIIPEGFSEQLIKRMRLAGFKSIQIGFESTSDNLLFKMNKKSRFSDNILFVKWSVEYAIEVMANVIQGIVDESTEDIIESIRNLHFLRFYFCPTLFRIDNVSLFITKSSKYYQSIQEERELWNKNIFYELLPKGFIEEVDRFEVFGFIKGTSKDILWNHFKRLANDYIQNKYSYSLIKLNQDIIYEEFLNDKKLKTLMFNTNEIHWQVLSFSNKRVVSLDKISDKFSKGENKTGITNKRIKMVLKELKDEGLLYYNNDFSEIVSIINTLKLIN